MLLTWRELGKFVSLGENCELGFFQKSNDSQQSSLFRWAFVPPAALLAAIEADFEGLYRFDNLTPSSNTMVLDGRFGINFHTKMHSQNGAFIQSEVERRAIHADEFAKTTHQVAKLRQSLKEPNIFVYKRSGPLMTDFAHDLGGEIAAKGPGKLLMVYDEGDTAVGDVSKVGANIFAGRLDRIPPNNKADDFSASGWQSITQAAWAAMN